MEVGLSGDEVVKGWKLPCSKEGSNHQGSGKDRMSM
jgi:hypothetical protein